MEALWRRRGPGLTGFGSERALFEAVMAEENTEDLVKTDEEESQGKPKKSIVPLLLITLLALSAGGFGAWFFALRPSKASKPKPKEAAVGEPTKIKSVLHIESFVVNLADVSDTAFLRVAVDIGLEKELKKEDTDKQPETMPRIRDTLLDVLSSYQSPELLAVDGKVKLRVHLLQALQARVPEVGIKEIYFTDFLVQR